MFEFIDSAWLQGQLTEVFKLFVVLVLHEALILLIFMSVKLHCVIRDYSFGRPDVSSLSCARCLHGGRATTYISKAKPQRRRMYVKKGSQPPRTR